MSKPRVRYVVSFPEPHTHFVQVAMSIDDADEGGVHLSLPVWTPGSYLVREYARHLEGIVARRATGEEVPVAQVDKRTWRVDTKPGKRVDVTYRVYANELTVRTSHVDADHAFLVSAGVFLHVRGREAEPCLVAVEPPEGWEVACPLPLKGENTWEAADLDELVDAPFEAGTHRTLTFEVCGVPHRIAVCGEGNLDEERLLEDTHSICRAAAEVFGGDHPCRSYLFLFHVLEGAGGGLEHRDSCVCGFAPHAFRPERSYLRQLTLISHEYFHLWNVKRIRPRELGPFDYGAENHTRLLWVSEGFTTYYQDLILRRAGLTSVPIWLDDLARMIRAYHETPGRFVESVESSSFNAWTKLYRPHENSRNATVSYYLKGAMVALLLDLAIRDATDGGRGLDDVLRGLWARWRARPDEGFTEEELLEALGEAAGRSLEPEVAAWVRSTEELPFGDLLAKAGLELAPRASSQEPGAWLGITVSSEGGKVAVKEVLADTPAHGAGLDAGDELIAIDGWRLGDLAERLGDRKPGDTAALTVARRGRLREVGVELGAAPPTDRVLRPREDAGERERRLFRGWADGELDEAAGDPGAPPKDPRPKPL